MRKIGRREGRGSRTKELTFRISFREQFCTAARSPALRLRQEEEGDGEKNTCQRTVPTAREFVFVYVLCQTSLGRTRCPEARRCKVSGR